MNQPEFDVVDLGTKHGNAIWEFLKKGRGYLHHKELESRLSPERCVGYERPQAASYRGKVEARGYKFRLANLADDNAIAALPTSEIYLAWHFLEHVPNKEWAYKLVKAALTNSRRFAWFRLPSFEQDDKTGEGVLKKHGMRFTWTNWLGHPTHWLVSDCVGAIREWEMEFPERKFDLQIRPADYIESMEDTRVVPIDTPVDVNEYHVKYGPKPSIGSFNPPIVAAWEVTVRFL